MDTGLVSRRAVIPDEGGEADACTTTADGFRAIALRSLDGNKGVNLHTFCLLEDVCVRLLIKNLGRQMQEGVVRDKLTGFLSKESSSAPGSVTRNPSRPAPYLRTLCRQRGGRVMRPASLGGDVHRPKRPSA